MIAFPGQGAPVPGPRGQEGHKYAQWDAAYVLGSLSEMDWCEFDRHLGECRACRGAVAELSDMPALLSLLDRDEVTHDDDPAAVRPPWPQPDLVGRRWEMSAVTALLERALDGHGAVVGVVGSPGIGKSRLVREVSAMADAHDVDVFTAFCESHTSQVPFHAVARLLRAITGIGGLDPQAARARSWARAACASRPSTPMAVRNSRATAWKGTWLVCDSQKVENTSTPRRLAIAETSRTRRLLPMPGEPTTPTTAPCPSMARSNKPSTVDISQRRPTRFDSARSTARRPSGTPSSRWAQTG